MSKAETLNCVLLCITLAIASYAVGLMVYALPLLLIGFMFTLLLTYKFVRDRGIISRARREAERAPTATTPPITSQGSQHLFVPPPLDRRSELP